MRNKEFNFGPETFMASLSLGDVRTHLTGSILLHSAPMAASTDFPSVRFAEVTESQRKQQGYAVARHVCSDPLNHELYAHSHCIFSN